MRPLTDVAFDRKTTDIFGNLTKLFQKKSNVRGFQSQTSLARLMPLHLPGTSRLQRIMSAIMFAFNVPLFREPKYCVQKIKTYPCQ